MFTSTKWMNHPLSNKDAGKKVISIIVIINRKYIVITNLSIHIFGISKFFYRLLKLLGVINFGTMLIFLSNVFLHW